MSKVCFDQNIFFVSIIILMIVTGAFMYYWNKQKKDCPVPICPKIKCPECPKTIIKKKPKKFVDYVRKRDIQSLKDDLTEPSRRPERHQRIYNSPLYNYSTRGPIDTYHNLGILKRQKDGKTILLFGRPTYPGSTKWEYYGTTKEDDQEIKMNIGKEYNKEILDKDKVFVELYPKGKFTFYEHRHEKLRYNPYVF